MIIIPRFIHPNIIVTCCYCDKSVDTEIPGDYNHTNEFGLAICQDCWTCEVCNKPLLGTSKLRQRRNHLPPGSTSCCNKRVCQQCLQTGNIYLSEEAECIKCLRRQYMNKHIIDGTLIDSDDDNMDDLIESLHP